MLSILWSVGREKNKSMTTGQDDDADDVDDNDVVGNGDNTNHTLHITIRIDNKLL